MLSWLVYVCCGLLFCLHSVAALLCCSPCVWQLIKSAYLLVWVIHTLNCSVCASDAKIKMSKRLKLGRGRKWERRRRVTSCDTELVGCRLTWILTEPLLDWLENKEGVQQMEGRGVRAGRLEKRWSHRNRTQTERRRRQCVVFRVLCIHPWPALRLYDGEHCLCVWSLWSGVFFTI